MCIYRYIYIYIYAYRAGKPCDNSMIYPPPEALNLKAYQGPQWWRSSLPLAWEPRLGLDTWLVRLKPEGGGVGGVNGVHGVNKKGLGFRP